MPIIKFANSIDKNICTLCEGKTVYLCADLRLEVVHDNTNTYKLSIVDECGKEVVKTFSKIQYSEKGKLLFNAITTEIEEMGQSITEQEK